LRVASSGILFAHHDVRAVLSAEANDYFGIAAYAADVFVTNIASLIGVGTSSIFPGIDLSDGGGGCAADGVRVLRDATAPAQGQAELAGVCLLQSGLALCVAP
jgi:hypothetical protein